MSRTVCEHFVEEGEPCEECDKAGGELAALMEDAAAIILKMKDTLAVRGARPTTEKEAALWDECFAVYVRMVKWANRVPNRRVNGPSKRSLRRSALNAVLGGISQETPMELCYSINEEDFNLTSVEDVLDTLDNEGRLEEGAVYWEADCRRMQASDVFSVEQVLENMCERLYEEVGEIADDYPAVPPEAKTELKYFLTAWVEKHAPPNQYWMVVGKPREKRVTADDLPPNAGNERPPVGGPID